MKRDDFDALVARLEPIALSNPTGYEWRVIALAGLGYAYLGLVIALIVGLIVGSVAAVAFAKFVAIKALIILVPFLWLVLKALWIRFPAPEGIEITREYAPPLFDMIDELRDRLQCAPFHHVLIVDDFNASVVQNPRLGPFGWHRNYLLIGLPLMKALTPEQLKAVLAHEFGHLAGGHGAVANRLYRLRMSWERLLFMLQQQDSAGMFLFLPFFKRFSPYFSAYSFPLARANEYYADKVAAELTGADTAAKALTSVEVAAAYLDTKFWPGIHKFADERPDPGFTPFRSMSGGFAEIADADTAQAAIDSALKVVTGSDNTHPAFSDRLKALGQPPSFAPPAEGKGADTLLGESLDRITTLFDERWKSFIQPSWEARFEEVRKKQEEMRALEAKLEAGEQLSVDEAFRHASLFGELRNDPDAALALWVALHERAPEHMPTCFYLGTQWLQRDNDAGIGLIEKCMDREPDSITAGCEQLFGYFKKHGREAEARRCQDRYEARMSQLGAINDEQEKIRLSDKYGKHELSADALAALLADLRAIGKLRKVYFVRRHLKHSPDLVHHVLGFVVTPVWKWQNKQEVEEVQKRILALPSMPADTMVFCVEGDNADFWKKFRWMSGSRIL